MLRLFLTGRGQNQIYIGNSEDPNYYIPFKIDH